MTNANYSFMRLLDSTRALRIICLWKVVPLLMFDRLVAEGNDQQYMLKINMLKKNNLLSKISKKIDIILTITQTIFIKILYI